MRNAKWIVLMAIICILAISLPAMAQLEQGGWPKANRDYYNSGLSPATVIAKPVVKWASQCKPWGGSSSAWYTTTYDGVKIDADGNVFAYADYCFGMAKFSSTGTLLANDSGCTDANMLLYYNGPALFDDGTNKLVICGPQQYTSTMYSTSGTDPDCPALTGYVYNGTGDKRRVEFLDRSLAYQYSSPVTNMANAGSFLPACSAAISHSSLPGWTTHTSPAIGPDGTVYACDWIISYYDNTGPLVAYNPLDGSIKWSFTDTAVGRLLGTPAIKTVDDGGVTKNVLYVAGGTMWEPAATYGYPSVYAVRDDGTSATLLWSKTIKSTDNDPTWGASCGFYVSGPTLSSDGSTLYVAGKENWPLRRQNTNTGRPAQITGTLFAYDADTGAIKWKITTGGSHSCTPALGPDGTVYLTGGHMRTGAKSDVPPLVTPGRVVAVTDNGTSASIKWTVTLPDDECSDTTPVAVVNTTPAVMYVATGNGRVYCIQDQGTYGKILWTWQAYDLRYSDSTSRGFAPSNIAVADDGTVCISLRNYVYAFDTGFDPSSPEGISGVVKDSSNNPIADAWVCASTSANPLADTPKRLWTKTSADGTYQISPKDAGTYYVAAAAVGYKGSADQSADLTALTNKVTCNFTLETAKHNWAFGSPTSGTNIHSTYKAQYAVDGDMNTKYHTSTTPATLVVDIGDAKSIDEVVIYWEWRSGVSYSVDYSNDNSTWNTAYSTAAGNGGFPIEWKAGDPTVAGPPYADGVSVGPGGGLKNADVVKFPAVSARYWRISTNSGAYGIVGTYTTKTGSTTVPGIYELEIRDSSMAQQAPYGSIGEAKNGDAGMAVSIADVKVTAHATSTSGLPSYNRCLEDDSRTSGIRAYLYGVSSSIKFADRVSVVGKVVTDGNGEKYLAATSMTRLGTASSPTEPALAELSVNNKSACDEVSEGLFVKTWGVASTGGTDYFMLTDGSTVPIKVKCGALTQPADGTFITVRGVMGKDADGPVLYMRDEQADWVAGDDFMSLPLTGTYKYPLQYLVLGPFTDSGLADYELIYNAFITEDASALSPKAGDTLAGKTWTVGTSVDGILDLNAMYGSAANHAVFYVFLYAWSPSATTTLTMPTGSDDWLRAWVDSTEVVTVDDTIYPSGRTVVIGQDGLTPITLNAGLNKIMFKVINTTEDSCGLASQFVDSATTGTTGYGGYASYTGLGYSLNPAP